ncbi:MAG: AAA family ATPase [Patescibacteria group bacterium]
MTKFSWPITGNENRLAELERDLLSDQLSHAYLFAGPPEVGKFTAAKAFAKFALCANGVCGKCEDCRQIRANIHPNLTIVDELWIEGINENFEAIAKKSNFNQTHRSRNPKAKTDTIRIEDLREILARIHNTRDGRQIFIIHNIERLNRESANHFLKTLEEPPPRTTFLLTTNNLPLLLPTLVSRCRVLQFGNVNPSAIESMLSKKFPGLSPDERSRIVNFSMGKPIRAERLAADPDILREYAEYFRRLKNLLERPDTADRMTFAEEVTRSTPETQKFLEAFTYFLRSFLLTRARKPIAGSRYSNEKLVNLLRATNRARSLVVSNVNPRLTVENLLLSI